MIFGILLVALLQVAPGGMWPRLAALLKFDTAKLPRPKVAEPLPPRSKAIPASETLLDIQAARKQFGGVIAVNDVSFSVKRGEFFSLLGPSGCGKTTLLRMLGGFEHPDSGRIYLEGKDITDLPPNPRRVHTVFQNYALFPTMTVWDNIAFSLKLAKRPKAEVEERVVEHFASQTV